MKTQILDINGKKAKEIETNLFEEPIREDIIFKVIEAEKIKHPSSPKYRAGMDKSASGALSKRRHVWKSDRGKGLSRLPRKIMSRRGTQFNWVGALIPSARGGRRAHPPKGSVLLNKINKKELKKALLSALSYSSSIEELKKKYLSLETKKLDNKLPLIVEEKIFELKTKEFLKSLEKILGELYSVSIQKKTIRSGKGKMRGRKNKKNAGLLFVIGKDEKKKIKGIEVVKVNELTVRDLADNGARVTLFSENAISELDKVLGGRK
ncbi:50S ribosomal protein L4 [archaeon]|jgi:large subunit ribosomal protein L4e|nr:50S ribosomal protein L4 [archaeon]MBT4242132.1 50S ribosomal protein L4 [archaeon]MBT4417820.1 50S ribosomal protein L4 [archaeon]